MKRRTSRPFRAGWAGTCVLLLCRHGHDQQRQLRETYGAEQLARRRSPSDRRDVNDAEKQSRAVKYAGQELRTGKKPSASQRLHGLPSGDAAQRRTVTAKCRADCGQTPRIRSQLPTLPR